MPKLGVNIDHVATVREARKVDEPDPVFAAQLCEKAGCDSIVCHLREDRRHINDDDLKRLKKAIKARLNLEMSINKGIVRIACRVKPDQATLVPEKRQELTTEGGLDVVKKKKAIRNAVQALTKNGIEASLFIDPEFDQIYSSRMVGVKIIELHTGEYANAKRRRERTDALKRIECATIYALRLGMVVNAGHGLNYANVKDVARIPGINELNIGHSIVARSVIVGVERAVQEMLELIG